MVATSRVYAFVLFITCVLPLPASAQEHLHPPEHAQLHAEFYTQLRRPDVPDAEPEWKKSCCSKRDCKPVQARFRDGNWEALSVGRWLPIPQSKILDNVKSPDTQAHLCASEFTHEILCFVKPDYGT